MFAVSAFLMFSSLSSPAVPHSPFLILWESILQAGFLCLLHFMIICMQNAIYMN